LRRGNPLLPSKIKSDVIMFPLSVFEQQIAKNIWKTGCYLKTLILSKECGKSAKTTLRVGSKTGINSRKAMSGSIQVRLPGYIQH